MKDEITESRKSHATVQIKKNISLLITNPLCRVQESGHHLVNSYFDLGKNLEIVIDHLRNGFNPLIKALMGLFYENLRVEYLVIMPL
jgi:hypothetical protein